MSNDWFCNQRDGSVKSASLAEIEDLVSKGVLSPDSLLSKDGASDWMAANQFNELKPYFEKNVDSEDTSESARNINQSIAVPRAGLIDVLKGGLIYATNLVKRFKLRYWNLPPLYRNLGRTISISDPPRLEFPGLTDQLDRITAELDAHESNAPARPAGFVPTIRWFAIKSIRFIQLHWLYYQKSWLHWKLGVSAYNSRLESSGPTYITKPIAETHAKIDQADQELARLSHVNTGDWITPRNSGFVFLFVIMIGLLRAIAGITIQNEQSSLSPSGIVRTVNTPIKSTAEAMEHVEEFMPKPQERNSSNNRETNKERVVTESRNQKQNGGNMEAKFEALVFKVKMGMHRQQVENILGTPDKTKQDDLGEFNPQKAGQTLDILTWGDEQDFIILGFTNGILTGGGTRGYDIEKGFHGKLPSDVTGSERKKLKSALEGIGFRVDD